MIASDRFIIDGEFAWWVIENLDTFHDYEYLDLDRPCETWRPVCNRIGPNFGKPDHNGCPDCGGSGRHTFDIDVEAPDVAPIYLDGSPMTRTYRVSIVPNQVLEIREWQSVLDPPTGRWLALNPQNRRAVKLRVAS